MSSTNRLSRPSTLCLALCVGMLPLLLQGCGGSSSSPGTTGSSASSSSSSGSSSSSSGSSSGAVSLVYSFKGGTADGQEPHGKLMQTSNGTLYGLTYQGGTYGLGTMFSVTTAGTETVLRSFTNADGTNPHCGVIQGSDSNLYGVTFGDGANPAIYGGTVFSFNPSSLAFSVIYSFVGGNADGADSHGCVMQASDGNLYLMTNQGGPNNLGAIVRVSPTGTETVLHLFAGGTADGSLPFGNLVQASDGNLYGMTEAGGAGGNGVIFSLNPATSAYNVRYSFGAGSNDVVQPFGAMVQASNGLLYGMAAYGGANSVGGIFSFDPTSSAEAVVYSFASGSDGAVPQGSLIVASDGNLYGMTTAGGAANVGTVFRFSPTTKTETVLHQFAGGPADGAVPLGDLLQASDGKLYGLTSAGGATSCGVSSGVTTYCGAVFSLTLP